MISGGSVLSMLLHHPVPEVLGESSELPSYKVLGCLGLPFFPLPLELLETEDVAARQGRFACCPEASGTQSSSKV